MFQRQKAFILSTFAVLCIVFLIFILGAFTFINYFDGMRHLQVSADAASLAGAMQIGDASPTAVKTLADNYVKHNLSNDWAGSIIIQTGNWDAVNKTFSENQVSFNAVLVQLSYNIPVVLQSLAALNNISVVSIAHNIPGKHASYLVY